MSNDNSIFGYFVSGPNVMYDWDQKKRNEAGEQGKLFRDHIWGENGIDAFLKKLEHKNYGNDLILILFQFYLNPFPSVLNSLKEIENYRKKERAIGIPVIVNEENFFNRSDKEKNDFLKKIIFQKLDVLAARVKKSKLDTRVDLLIADLEKVWN